MVSSIIDVPCTLCDENRDEHWPDHEREGIDEFINHCISDIGVFCPDMPFRKD
jgi:hypothetical protein